MPNVELKTVQDIEDFARGNDFMSACGGGPTTESVANLKDTLRSGKPLRIRDIGELRDDAKVASVWFSGSIAPSRYNRGPVEKEYGLKAKTTRPLLFALALLEKFMGRTFDALIPTEIGGNNTGSAVDIAAQTGKMLIDGDYAGRAIPEAMCLTPAIAGKALWPLACANHYGDEVLIQQNSNIRMNERIKKHIAMASFGGVGCAGMAFSGKEVKELALPGTVSRSLTIGRAIRTARERGQDPLDAVTKQLGNAWVLFRGVLDKRTWESRDGYMWGEHEFQGFGPFAGRRMRMWFKNENHITWLDGEPYVASPDVIEVVDAETGEPIVNSFLEEGRRVGVIGVKRMPQYDTPERIASMNPRHWGFDLEYVPIERLVG